MAMMNSQQQRNQQQQQEKKQSPWDSVMAQILMQQGMLGNNNFLWGAILSGLLSNGWKSQKRRYEEALDNYESNPSKYAEPGKDYNLYSSINNWLGGMFGTRKPRPADNTEFYKTHDPNFGATSMLDYGTKDLYQSDRDNAMKPYTWDDARIANEVKNAMTPDSYNNDLTHQLAIETISPTQNLNSEFSTLDITAPKYENELDKFLKRYGRL